MDDIHRAIMDTVQAVLQPDTAAVPAFVNREQIQLARPDVVVTVLGDQVRVSSSHSCVAADQHSHTAGALLQSGGGGGREACSFPPWLKHPLLPWPRS